MGGSKTTTQRTTSEPWEPAQPALKLGLGDAQNLYQSGIGSQPYTGSTVVPWSNQTMQGMQALQNNANANLGGTGLSGQYQNIINSGGFNQPQQTALNNLNRTATNPFDITADPAYMAVRNRIADDVTTGVNLGASSAGRYGSGAHTQALTDALSQNLAAMDVDQLTRMQGRQDAATQNLFNAGQTGMSNIGNAYQGLSMPIQDLVRVGGMNEDLATRTKNDELRIFQEMQNSPWNQLGLLNAVASGTGTLGGTSTAKATQPGNLFGDIFGGLSSGLGLLGLLGL